MPFESDVTWQNKHLNVSANVERLYDAWNRLSDRSRPERNEWLAGLGTLQQIVRDAEAMGKRVRGLGGGWSLSPAAVTQDHMAGRFSLAVHCLVLIRIIPSLDDNDS